MKKFFTLVAMALMAVGANAQELIAEVDFTTATEFTGWNQFGDGQEGSVELKAGEGLAITVGSQTGQLWQPQTMVIPDGTFNVEEDGNYKVVVEAKFPTAGELQINMGTWGSNDQTTVQVPASDDFQTVEIEFPAFAYTLEGCHLLFQNGDFLGTTIVKTVKVFNLDAGGQGGQSEGTVLYENDFTGITEFTGWNQFGDGQEGSVAVDPDGIAITVGSQTGQLWQPQTMIIPDGSFNVEEDGNYKVVVVAKFPTAGTLQINMGTWGSNDQTTVDVPASDDFQTVEIEFPAFAYTLEGCHLLFQNGDFLGTTIVKSVKVIDLDGDPNGIEAVKANQLVNGAIFNLAGQKVNANYKGVVIQNGKKFIQK
jgi:hypothetical protein